MKAYLSVIITTTVVPTAGQTITIDYQKCIPDLFSFKDYIEKNNLDASLAFLRDMGKCLKKRAEEPFADKFHPVECDPFLERAYNLPLSPLCKSSAIGASMEFILFGDIGWPSDMDDVKYEESVMRLPEGLKLVPGMIWKDCANPKYDELLTKSVTFMTESAAYMLTDGMECTKQAMEMMKRVYLARDFDLRTVRFPMVCKDVVNKISQIISKVDSYLPPLTSEKEECPFEIQTMRNITAWMARESSTLNHVQDLHMATSLKSENIASSLLNLLI